jgi:outer membrane protein assembly factor BamB
MMARQIQAWLVRASLTLATAATATAADWPRFRGPNGSGVVEARNLPTEFSPVKNVRWKTALPIGHSSPVLVGNRMIVTAFEKDKLLTIALDLDSGKILWRGEITRARADRLHDNNNPAAPSVAADRENVYAFFADFGLVSYTLDGKERWRVPLGPFRSYHGMGSSPILAGRTLLLNCDQDVGSFLVAIDTANGSIRWRKDRTDKPGNGFSTPLLNEAGDEVMVLGPTQLTAYAVADGAKLWWVGGLPRQPKGSPVLAKDSEGRPLVILSVQTVGDEQSMIGRMPPWQVLVSMLDTNKDGKITKEDLTGQFAGFIEPFMQADANGDGELSEEEWKMYTTVAPNALLAFRPEGRGDLTSKVLWRQAKAIPNVPTPLVYQNVLYVIKEGGVLTSLNPATGETFKQGRVTGALGFYFASPVAADGKIYLTSQDGHIAVLKAGPQWEILRVNSMDEEMFATPALADGRIYVRTRAALYCMETPPPQP